MYRQGAFLVRLLSLSCGIALCTCNGAKFLQQQLDSIIAQSIPPREIVVCDDCSEDGSWDILQKWAAEIARPNGIQVTLIQNTSRLGVTRNFEQACSKLGTDLIFLCDQDDVWPSDKVFRLMTEFGNRDVMLVYSDAYLVDANLVDFGITLFQALRITKREKQLIEHQRFFELFCRRNIVTGATLAFRRSLLSVAQPFPSEWIHDEWLAVVAASCGRVVMLQDCLLFYRQHGTNAIGVPKSHKEYLAHARKVFKTSRDLFLAKRIRRLEVWLARVECLGDGHDGERRFICGALKHFRIRSRMTGNPISRFIEIWSEWKSGRYLLYSGVRRGLLPDLLYL